MALRQWKGTNAPVVPFWNREQCLYHAPVLQRVWLQWFAFPPLNHSYYVWLVKHTGIYPEIWKVIGLPRIARSRSLHAQNFANTRGNAVFGRVRVRSRKQGPPLKGAPHKDSWFSTRRSGFNSRSGNHCSDGGWRSKEAETMVETQGMIVLVVLVHSKTRRRTIHDLYFRQLAQA